MHLAVRVRMPSERDKAVETIRAFVREGDASVLKPERMRMLRGYSTVPRDLRPWGNKGNT
jgi:hypothetical protein